MSPLPVRRTAEIEEWTNRHLIHPVSAALVPVLARCGVHPNLVSLFGMGCGLAAGLSYWWWRHPLACALGFGLMVGWHVADGADGQLARMTGKQSASGKVLDGICDYATFVAVYVALGVSLAQATGLWVVLLVAFAGLCHALQSAAYEARRESYDAIAHGQLAAPPAAAATRPSRRHTVRDRLQDIYAALQRASGNDTALHAACAAAVARDPACEPDLRARYRAVFAPLVRRWSVLCANYRTVGIFFCAVIGHPLWYFGFEIVGFSAVLLLLSARQRRVEARFVAALDRPVPATV